MHRRRVGIILSCVDQNGKPSNTPLDTSTLGIHTLTVFARDNAGHITTASAQYEVVKFSGFFTPVDNPPALNSAKAGAGVPVKFRLQRLQGGVLVAISDPTAIANVTAVAQTGRRLFGNARPDRDHHRILGTAVPGRRELAVQLVDAEVLRDQVRADEPEPLGCPFKTDRSPRGTAAAFALFKFK